MGLPANSQATATKTPRLFFPDTPPSYEELQAVVTGLAGSVVQP